jgi:23S rRNA pseudouridine1911/1915/1917 synthase
VSTIVPQAGQVCFSSEVSLVGTPAIVTFSSFHAKRVDLMNADIETGKTAAVIHLTVPKQGAGARLDRFLADNLAQFSRSRIQQLIRSGAATLNGKAARPRDVVRPGDSVRLEERPLEKATYSAENIPLEILFEDDALIVLNKAAGLVVHPGAGHKEHTLVNALLGHCPTLSGIGGEGCSQD